MSFEGRLSPERLLTMCILATINKEVYMIVLKIFVAILLESSRVINSAILQLIHYAEYKLAKRKLG